MKTLRNTFLFLGAIALMFLMTIASLIRPDIPLDRLLPVYTDATSGFLDVDGMRVHYRDEGEGPAVLLIHGTFASLHTWDGWTEAMRDSFRIVRLDLPGFGLTGPHPDNDYGTRATLHLLEHLRTHLEIEQWSLAGNSLGARYALDYARHFPERTDRLILLNAAIGRLPEPSPAYIEGTEPSAQHAAQYENTIQEAVESGSAGKPDIQIVDPDQLEIHTGNPHQPDIQTAATSQEEVRPGTPNTDRQPLTLRMINHPRTRNLLTVLTPRAVIQMTLKGVYYDGDKVEPDVVQRYFELLRREGNRAAFLTRNDGATGDRSHLIPLSDSPRAITDLGLPVLIMWGEHDTWIRAELGRRLHERMPGSELIIYPNAGHVPMEEIPAISARDAMEFLTSM